MTTLRTPRRADIDGFYTCRNAAKFKIDWRSFYNRAEARTDQVRARWPHELDIAYGPHVQHRLDLYLPTPAAGVPAPVFLFLHGGGFREGDPALYGYLAEPYLERGIVFGSLGYRLTPEAYLPDTMRDVEAALSWCYANLAQRGARPTQIVLAGHSAGAILTAHLAVRTDWLAANHLPEDLLKAAIPISGVYDFTDPSKRQEFFSDDARRAEASPLLSIAATPPNMVVAYGSDENGPEYGADSLRLVEAVRARGGLAELLLLKGADHAATAHALSDPSSPLFNAVDRLIAAPEASAVRGNSPAR